MIDTTQKLQAFLAHAGVASRRKAEELISAGKVKVNGQVAHLGQRVSNQDQVSYQGQTLKPQTAHAYYLINKPVGLVSTVSDELGRSTVLSLLPPELSQQRLYPVGRLDQDSQGLMLLTDDGEVAYRMTHPKFEIAKTYQVTLERTPTPKAVDHFKRGVRLTDGWAKPSLVTQKADRIFEVTLTEGRNRQVRRMWARVGYEVTSLTRVAFGPFKIEDLDGKTFRALTDKEIATLTTHLKAITEVVGRVPQAYKPKVWLKARPKSGPRTPSKSGRSPRRLPRY